MQAAPYASDILEAFPGPALVLNTSRQILGANEAALTAFRADGLRDILGRRPGEAAGCVIAERAPGGCGTGHDCRYCGVLNAMNRSLDGKGRARGEGLLSTVDGGTLNIDVAVNCIEVDGESMLFLGFRDISAEKHRDFMQGAFLHDLANTAGGLQGLLEITEDQQGVVDELMPTIQDLVKSLVEEIEGQRHLLQAEQGRLQTRFAPVDLDALARQLTTLYRSHPVARERTLTLSSPGRLEVVSDASLLRRVLGNMLKNALEATPEGGTVTIDMKVEPPNVCIEVHNPTVIPRAARAHVFKRGFSTKGGSRGTGTHAMRVLLDQYLDGAIEFESREGDGTRFRMTIPVEPRGWEPVSPAGDRTGLVGSRVLVADDDPINRRLSAHRFERQWAQVVTVNSGEAALELLERDAFDLVLMDVEMPGVGGLSAAQQVTRQPTPDRPMVVMLSGHEEPPSNPIGWDLWIAKPLRDRDLDEVGRRRAESRAESHEPTAPK